MRFAPARPRAGLVAAAAAIAAVALTSPSVASAAPSPGATVPAGLDVVRTRTSLLGTHTWYQQTFAGLPVIGGWYAVHADRTGLPAVADGRLAVPAGLDVRPVVAASAALAAAGRPAAKAAAEGDVAPAGVLAVRPGTAGTPARLVWRVVGTQGGESTETLVDARTGAVLSARSLVRRAEGTGRVFQPNPSVTLRTQALRDRGDADQAVLDPAYRRVTLTDLFGSGRLRGRFVSILNGNAAFSATNTFSYKRSDDRFEQVMAYHHLTVAQRYIQSLGFLDVNAESQDVYTNTIPDDNSFYDPGTDRIVFGRGGVDDAEDAEVIWHEYGHAIQDDQVPGFGATPQAGAIGEGFGDYWAATMSVPVSNGFDVPCIADWDATSYTVAPHCLRRTDGTKTVADLDGEVHDDGEIWSRALWDLQKSLGRTRADVVILESQFRYAPGTSFAAAASDVVATARALYGNSAAGQARTAFHARGILP